VSRAIQRALRDLAIHARRWRASARKDLLERALAKERLLNAIARVDATEASVRGGGRSPLRRRLSDSARGKLP